MKRFCLKSNRYCLNLKRSRLNSNRYCLNRKGFTIVEITIAMTFVATLLITVALVIMHIMTIYQKGLALRSVNSVGGELVDEFSRAIKLAPTKGVTYLCNRKFPASDASTRAAYQNCINNNAHILTYQQYTYNGTPAHGVFCTGRYSYIWNTGYALNNNVRRASLSIGSDTYEDFRLLRVSDDNRALCTTNISATSYNYTANSTSPATVRYAVSAAAVDYSAPTEILNSADNALALYDFVVFPSTLHAITQHSFYSMTFTLGTLQGGIDIRATGNYCNDEASTSLSSDFNYCAVNKFNFSVRATGELTSDERSERGYY